MQDRFKFRVWLKELIKPRMTYTSGLSINKNQIDDSDNIVMQCTGLKDKNGKLIYEGDIVTPVYSNASLLEPPFTGQVVSGKACFEIKSPHIAYNALQILNSEKAFEIIGNIYENSELLESEPTNE